MAISALRIINEKINLPIFRVARHFHFENIPHGGVKPERDIKTYIKNVIDAHKNLSKSLKLSFREFKNYLKDIASSEMVVDHMHYKYFAKFRDISEEDLDRWTVTTDAVDQGRTTATLSKHPKRGTVIFSGYLDTTVPLTGDIVRSGMASFRSPHKVMFGRVFDISFLPYNYIVVKYRGDGRTYSLNIQMNHWIDIEWHDMFTFPLFTKGGPYWQTAKIPFHKFFLVAKGRSQDVQTQINRNRVRHVSVTLMDGVKGQFSLEVDSIVLQNEWGTNEMFSYESYSMPDASHRFK